MVDRDGKQTIIQNIATRTCVVCVVSVCVGGAAYWSRVQCLYYTLHCCVSSIMLLYENTPTTVWANETFYVGISKLWKNTMIASHHASLTSVLQMTNAWVGSLGYGRGLVLTGSVTE